MASEGDPQAVERVLMLDPQARAFPEIACQIDNVIINADRESQRLYEQGERSAIGVNLTPKALKQWFAAMVLIMDEMKHHMSNPGIKWLRPVDLYQLFNALARDRSRGKYLIDEDLGDAESFRREANRWRTKVAAQDWDIFSKKSVPV